MVTPVHQLRKESSQSCAKPSVWGSRNYCDMEKWTAIDFNWQMCITSKMSYESFNFILSPLVSCSINMYKIQNYVSCIVYIHCLPLTELLIYQCFTILDLLLVRPQATDLASNSDWSQSTQWGLEGLPLNMVCLLTHLPWTKWLPFGQTTFSNAFLNENDRIPNRITQKFVPRIPVDNKRATSHYLNQW